MTDLVTAMDGRDCLSTTSSVDKCCVILITFLAVALFERIVVSPVPCVAESDGVRNGRSAYSTFGLGLLLAIEERDPEQSVLYFTPSVGLGFLAVAGGAYRG